MLDTVIGDLCIGLHAHLGEGTASVGADGLDTQRRALSRRAVFWLFFLDGLSSLRQL